MSQPDSGAGDTINWHDVDVVTIRPEDPDVPLDQLAGDFAPDELTPEDES